MGSRPLSRKRPTGGRGTAARRRRRRHMPRRVKEPGDGGVGPRGRRRHTAAALAQREKEADGSSAGPEGRRRVGDGPQIYDLLPIVADDAVPSSPTTATIAKTAWSSSLLGGREPTHRRAPARARRWARAHGNGRRAARQQAPASAATSVVVRLVHHRCACGLSDAAIGALATIPAATKGADGVLCAVCLEDVQAGERVRQLLSACNHLSHADCVDAWLRAHRTCPLYRGELSTQNNVVDKASSDVLPPV